MASIEGYRYDIDRYYSIKDKLYRIASALEQSSPSAGRLNQETSSSYQIDNDPTIISERIGTLGQDMSDTASHIRRVIIPAIDDAIYYSKREIERLEEEEEEDEDD